MTESDAHKLYDLLIAYDAEYGTSNGRMTTEELLDDLYDSFDEKPASA